MPQRIVALDIEDAELKAAVLETSFRDYRIAGLYCDPIDGDGDSVADQLRRFLERHQLNGDTVVSTLPGRLISHRVFFLPFRDRKRLNQTVPFELETQVPFGLDDAIIDYQILHRDSSGTTVLAAMVQKPDLEAHLTTLKEAGVDPKTVDFAPLATVNVLRVLSKDLPDTFAFLEFGRTTVDVGLYRNQQLVGVRTITLSAPHVGNGATANGHGEDLALSPPHLAALIGDIRWSLMVINGAPLDDNVPCFVAGTRAWIEAVTPNLERELGFSVRRLDTTTVPTAAFDTRGALPECVTPLGLALREVSPANTLGVNFRRGEFTYHRGQQEVRSALARAGALLGVVLVLGLVNVFMDYQLQLSRLDAIQAQIRKVFVATLPNERPVNEAMQMQAELDKVEQRLKLVGGIVSLSGAATIDLLRAMAEKLPANVKVDVDEFQLDPDAIRLRGKTDSFEVVDAVKQHLVAVPYFRDVQVKDVKAASDGASVTFRMIIPLVGVSEGGP